MQLIDGIARRDFDGISDAQKTGEPPIHGNDHHGLTQLTQLVQPVARQIDSLLSHQRRIANRDAAAVNRSAYALASYRLEIARIAKSDATFLRAADNRRS